MRKKQILVSKIVTAVLVGLLGVVLIGAVWINQSKLEVILNGQSEVVLEYGQTYEDEGAYGILSRMFFGDSVWEAELAGGEVFDLNVLGTFTRTYRCKYFWHTAIAVRTVRVVDTQKPTIELFYHSDSYILPGQTYVEEGFAAKDNYDGDLTAKVTRRVEADTVIYEVSDSSGNTEKVTRKIKYGDLTAPDIQLLGEETVTIQVGTEYKEAGYVAMDNVDGDITGNVQITGSCDVHVPGTYTIQYTVTDSFGNTAERIRTVIVEPLRQSDVPDPNAKVIYLTFDDGPGYHTERLLGILEKYNVKATFFVVNTSYTYLLPKIAQAGHAIGMHTATHEYSEIYASEDAYFKDLHTIESIIFEKTGVKTTLIRFPGGSSNESSIKYCSGIMTRLTKAVQEQGYQYFDWNVSSGDAGGAKTAEEVYQNVINGVSGKKTSIVLQHDIQSFSVDAVERIIQWGLSNGYVFLPLDSNSPTCHHTVQN